MIDLEKEKKKLELKRVIYMREEMEYKILERMAEIERLKDNLAAQDKRIGELEAELKG
jgi:hypothetical protein